MQRARPPGGHRRALPPSTRAALGPVVRRWIGLRMARGEPVPGERPRQHLAGVRMGARKPTGEPRWPCQPGFNGGPFVALTAAECSSKSASGTASGWSSQSLDRALHGWFVIGLRGAWQIGLPTAPSTPRISRDLRGQHRARHSACSGSRQPSSRRRKIAHRLHPHVQSFGAPSSIQVLMRSMLDCGSAGAFWGMSEPHGGLVTFR